MTFDALAMHAVKDELEAVLLGGFVEKVLPISPLEVGFRVRAQHRDFSLMMSADAQTARVHLVNGTLRRLTEDVSPFLLLLRKYVRDGRIIAIEQPELERMITFVVSTFQENGSTVLSRLIIEVMGRHSNVILVGPDGKVLDALKRVPPSMSRQRPVLPHLPYSPPPPVDKFDPSSPLLARQLASAIHEVAPGIPCWRFLQETVGGIGPLAAREAVYRAYGIVSIGAGEVQSLLPLVEALHALLQPLQTRRWAPSIVLEESQVVHFAPYLLTQFPGAQVETLESISETVERAYAQRLSLRPAEALRVPVRASLELRLERARRKEDSLRQALTRGERATGLKEAGQAILANVSQIKPTDTELLWQGETISLDPSLSSAENAQRYFREYAKSRDAAREIPALLDAARLEREYLEQMLTHLELADGDQDIRVISRELAETAASPGQQRSPGPPKSGNSSRARQSRPAAAAPAGAVKRFTSSDGCQILVGGSARGNERVTFELGTGGDLWLHARGVPGAHVIIKLGGAEPPRRTLLEAARLAAAHSQARDAARVTVDYTLQRYVRKIRGAPPGLVTFSQEKSLRVEPAGKDPGTEE